MRETDEEVAAIMESCRGRDLDAHYLAFFECFNRGLYFEAHEVLEDLWLPNRQTPNGAFFKGLIQLTGAFVHLQKERPGPATALFKLTRANLEKYPARHARLDVAKVRELVEQWLKGLESGTLEPKRLAGVNAPKIYLEKVEV